MNLTEREGWISGPPAADPRSSPRYAGGSSKPLPLVESNPGGSHPSRAAAWIAKAPQVAGPGGLQ